MFDFQVLGRQIVKELSSLIEQNVILTDKNGFVIASTDPSRLNTYHEGACIAMRNREELHMTEEMCTLLRGVRPGMVLPIVISNTPIGVIGITGKPSEIEKYAKLVKKVVELFITEFIMRQERERGFREIEFFILDLFTTEATDESIEERAKLLNINIKIYTRVAIIQTFHPLGINDIEQILRFQDVHPELKIIRWGMEKLVLLLPDMNKSQLLQGLTDLSNKVGKTMKQPIFMGVGELRMFSLLRESFQQADVAVKVAARQNKIVFEEDLKLELLYYSIPDEIRDEFLNRTIAPLLSEEEMLHTLEVWLQSKGSLQDIADELHIHKNTLKYRLNKVEQHINVDFTDKNDLALIYTAIRLHTKK